MVVPLAVTSGAEAASAPSAVRTLAAVGGPTTGNMTVSWAAPTTGPVGEYFIATSADNGPFGAPVSSGTLRKRAMPCTGVLVCSFRVYATNTYGTGPSTDVTGTWGIPSGAIIKTATGGPTVGDMTVKWTPPKSNGGKAITSYLYEAQTDSAGPWNGPYTMSNAGTTGGRAQCPSVNPAGGCTFRIYPVNSVGVGPVSNQVAGPWNLPTASAITAVTPGRPVATATIEWSAPADTGGLAVHYRYQVSGDGGAFVNGASSLPDSPRKANVECPGTNNCSYKVIAYNSLGDAPISAAKTTAFNAPGPVSVGRAYVASTANLNLGSGTPSVTVSWGAPTATGGQPITSYQGRECDGNCTSSAAAWTSAPVVPLGTGGTWLTTCPAGQLTCSYQVRAVNAVGPGGWGAAIRITPFAVTGVTAATAPPVGTIAIGWTGPAEAGLGIDHLALFKCVVTSGCGNTANWTDTGQTIATGSHGTTDFCGSNIQCAYRVVAYEVTTGGGSASSASATATGSTLAGAPQNLTAASGTTIGHVDLSWQAPANSGSFPVSDYKFSRSVNGGPYSGDISTGSTALTYTDTGCGAANVCTYKVDAVTAAGTGPYSNTATAEGANVPSAPRTLDATSGTSLGAVDITWQAPLDNGGWPVTGYFLERSLDGGSTWPQSWTLGTSLSYTDTTCGQGTACTYRVSAINARGTGAVSNTDTATGTNLSPPQSLTATTSSTVLGNVDLSWAYPADDGGFTIQGYEYRYKIGAGSFTGWISTGTGTSLSFSHQCGQATTCTYEVRAFNAIGTSSPSNQATAQGLTDTTAPTVTVSTPTNGSIQTTSTPSFSGTAGNALGDSTTVNVTIRKQSDSSVVKTFAVTRSGTSWSIAAGDWATSGSPTSLGDLAYKVTATQSDWATPTNTGTSNTNNFTVDANAPVVTVVGPAANGIYSSSGTTYAGETAWSSNGCAANTICGTTADGTGLGVTSSSSVFVSIRQGTSGLYWTGVGSSFTSAAAVNLPVTGTTSWTVAFSMANVPQGGSYTVTASATDGAGLTSSTVTRTFNIDYDPAAAVFVGGTGASDSNNGLCPISTTTGCAGRGTGTGTSGPKATIAGGVSATNATLNKVAIASGSYPVTVTLTNASALTLVGGYDTSTFKRAASGTNTVTITGNGPTSTTGVVVDASAASRTVTLNQLTINSGTPSAGAGSSAYGLRAVGGASTSASVTLNRDVITAAAGGTGAGGTNGTTGANGTGGGTGTGGCDHCGSTGGSAGNAQTPGVGGAGGSNPGRQAGNNGVAGTSAGAAAGGGAGSGGCIGYYGGCKGTKGFGGGGGAAGSAGNAGPTNDTAYAGTFNAANGNGSTGTNGANGAGGGGGGAGGAGCDGFACVGDWLSGGAGGGGGGGGAGGTAGAPGGGAGGSFGIYTFNSTVTVDANTTVVTGNGGTGGAAGIGGTGGTGGGGGAGGAGNCTGGCANGSKAGGSAVSGGGGGGSGTAGSTGSNGNDGTDGSGCCNGNGGGGGGGAAGGGGGGGGRGGGGAGGPSVGVLAKGTGGVTIAAAQITIGTAGSGGGGGNAGAAGVAVKQKSVA